MARNVFYRFHYQRGSWRASKFRNIGVVEGKPSASDKKWEEVKCGGDPDIKREIDEQLESRTCTIVLIGSETAELRWVKYEIEKSWSSGKGVFGIGIHKIRGHNQQASAMGFNTFGSIYFTDGRRMSSLVKIYDSSNLSSPDVYAHISQNLAEWIEISIVSR